MTDGIEPSGSKFQTYDPFHDPATVPSSHVKPLGEMFEFDVNALSASTLQRINYLTQLDNHNDAMEDVYAEPGTWRCNRIHDHCVCNTAKGRRTYVKAEWINGECTWVQLEAMVLHNMYVLIHYAKQRSIMHHKDWKWVRTVLEDSDKLANIILNHNVAIRSGTRYKFGIEVPRNVRHALQLDATNGDTFWQDAIH